MIFKNCTLLINNITTINDVKGSCQIMNKVSIPITTMSKGYSGQVSNVTVIQFKTSDISLNVNDQFELFNSANKCIASGTIRSIGILNSYTFS